MSADNWALCPKCYTDNSAALKAEQERVAALYGKVSVDQFDRARRALKTLEDAEPEDTLREDYDIGISSGTFEVSYRGACERCGFVHIFKHSAPVAPGSPR